MGTPQVYHWPVSDPDGIALLQDTAGAASLVLNGALTSTVAGSRVVVFAGISRSVTLTSGNNLSARTFTIVGTIDGSALTVNIAGPNANTVQTTEFFSTVTSVSVNGVVLQVSVGSGTTGKTDWFNSNWQQAVANLAIQVDVIATTVNYSFVTTLDDVQTVPYGNLVVFTPITAMTAATTDQLAGYTIPARYSNITINSSNGTGQERKWDVG